MHVCMVVCLLAYSHLTINFKWADLNTSRKLNIYGHVHFTLCERESVNVVLAWQKPWAKKLKHGNFLFLYTTMKADCSVTHSASCGGWRVIAEIQLVIWMWNLAHTCAAALIHNPYSYMVCVPFLMWNKWYAARSGLPHDNQASP